MAAKNSYGDSWLYGLVVNFGKQPYVINEHPFRLAGLAQMPSNPIRHLTSHSNVGEHQKARVFCRTSNPKAIYQYQLAYRVSTCEARVYAVLMLFNVDLPDVICWDSESLYMDL